MQPEWDHGRRLGPSDWPTAEADGCTRELPSQKLTLPAALVAHFGRYALGRRKLTAEHSGAFHFIRPISGDRECGIPPRL